MPTLVVDACALLHLKQAHREDVKCNGLVVLEKLCDAGLVIASTPKVYAENCQLSLSAWLQERVRLERCLTMAVSVAERKVVRNALTGKMIEPGDNDKSLIALALRLNVPLLTHDRAAALLADRCKVLVVDAVDVGAFAARVGVVGDADVEGLLGPLGEHAWRPPSWQGSVKATVGGRPKWDTLRARLDTWWDGSGPKT